MSGTPENLNQGEDASQALRSSGEAAPITKGSKASKTRKSGASKAIWKSADDAILVETLIKERELGHQTDSGFKPVAFTACAEALKGSELTSGGAPKSSGSTKDHWDKVWDYFRMSRLSNLIRYSQLKKDFRTVKAIRESSGFGWDDTQKICTAPNDVWGKYIQVSTRYLIFNSVANEGCSGSSKG
jgi:hypothetical protein